MGSETDRFTNVLRVCKGIRITHILLWRKGWVEGTKGPDQLLVIKVLTTPFLRL